MKPSGPRRTPAELGHDYIPHLAAPFALNPQESISNTEDEVIALMLGHRGEDRQPQSRRLLGDRELGDVALVVGVVLRAHEHMFADNLLTVNTSNVQGPGTGCGWPRLSGPRPAGRLGGVLFGALVLVYVEDQVVAAGAADVEVEGGILFQLAEQVDRLV